jgi:DNA polymerase III subunit delta'
MEELPYPWLTNEWQRLTALGGVPGAATSGAILLHGPAGVGKLALARHFAAALLCSRPGAGQVPCGECAACRLRLAGNHPDLVAIRPETVQIAEGLEAQAEEEAAEIDEAPGEKKSRRAPSKEIRIEQIRSMSDAMTRSSHQGGARVVLIYPAHTLNQASGNALLKVLEEPPVGTVFVLVSERAERLLPTVRSRCRDLAVGVPDTTLALEWLSRSGVHEAENALAAAGGAPLVALESAEQASEAEPVRRELIDALARPAGFSALRLAERISSVEPALVVGWLLRWTHDCISYRIAQRIRYHPKEGERLARRVAHAAPLRLLNYQRELMAQRRVAEHPLNKRLFLESLLMRYQEALEGS